MRGVKLSIRDAIRRMVNVDDIPEEIINDIARELEEYVDRGYVLDSNIDELAERLVSSYRERIIGKLMSNVRQHMPGRRGVEKVLPFLIRETLEEGGFSSYTWPLIMGQQVDLAVNVGAYYIPVVVIGHNAGRGDLYRLSRLRRSGIRPLVISQDETIKDSIPLKVDYLDEPYYYKVSIAMDQFKRMLGEVSLIGERYVKPMRIYELAYVVWRGLRKRGYLVVPRRNAMELEVYGFGKYLVRVQGKPTMWDPSYRMFNMVVIVTGGSGVKVRERMVIVGVDYLERLMDDSGMSIERLRKLVSGERYYVE